jgi:hypothetical protein
MKKIVRIALALTLGAACAAPLTVPAPAHACGGEYGLSPEMQVRMATLDFLRENRPDAQSPRIHSVKVDGKKAKVQIRFVRAKRTGEVAQLLSLTENGGEWTVTGQGFPVSAPSASLFSRK